MVGNWVNKRVGKVIGKLGLGVAVSACLLSASPGWASLGMPEAELARHYPWEAGPEGTRLYQLGEAIFSPLLIQGHMRGAIAELPATADDATLKRLLRELTPGMRQAPAQEQGTIAQNTWEYRTPDYQAMAMQEGERVFVLIQQIEPLVIPDLPTTTEDAAYRAENDLEILQMALETYRAQHWFRYPEAKSYDELIKTLDRAGVLPDGYKLSAPLTEFGVWKTGYRITVRAGDRPITIRQPERFDPFWVFWQVRPFP